MAFHAEPVEPRLFRSIESGQQHHMLVPKTYRWQPGDLVRLDETRDNAADTAYTGRHIHRQVVQTVDLGVDPVSGHERFAVVMVPLDHPLMRQLEVAKDHDSTSVLWVGSCTEIRSGSTVPLRLNGTVEVLRSFISLRAIALPPQARIDFLTEVSQ